VCESKSMNKSRNKAYVYRSRKQKLGSSLKVCRDLISNSDLTRNTQIWYNQAICLFLFILFTINKKNIKKNPVGPGDFDGLQGKKIRLF
jgi:hypothetical protein